MARSYRHIQQYDTILIGYPNWWGTLPMPFFTLLEQHDMAGKTLIPFCTHEGNGLSGFGAKLAAAVPGAKVLEGLAVTGRTAQKDRKAAEQAVDGWLQGLGQ